MNFQWGSVGRFLPKGATRCYDRLVNHGKSPANRITIEEHLIFIDNKNKKAIKLIDNMIAYQPILYRCLVST
jgi:hypothetical protein